MLSAEFKTLISLSLHQQIINNNESPTTINRQKNIFEDCLEKRPQQYSIIAAIYADSIFKKHFRGDK